MPNWCSTNVSFYGRDAELESLRSVVKHAQEIETTDWFKENVGFSNVWLGSIAMALGYAVDDCVAIRDKETGNYTIVNRTDEPVISGCRGCMYLDSISTYEYRNRIYVDVDSAWAPPEELIEAIEAYCGVSADWIATEPGCGVFINTNPDTFGEIFELDTSDDFYYPSSEKELLNIVRDKYGVIADSYEDLYEQVHAENDALADWSVNAYTDINGTPWYIINRQNS